MVIKDKFTLGALSGIVGSLPQVLLLIFADRLHLINHSAWKIAGGIFLYAHLTETPTGIILSASSWLISASFFGVIIALVLEWKGRAFWWVKGLIIDLGIMFIFIYGFLFNMGDAKVIPQDRSTNLVILVSNIVFALTTSYLINRWWNPKITSNPP